eukprot:10835427-Prorocentrum_lima.AAC.1
MATRPGHWNFDVTHRRPGRYETTLPAPLPTLRTRWPGTGAFPVVPGKPPICTSSASAEWASASAEWASASASGRPGLSYHKSLPRLTASIASRTVAGPRVTTSAGRPERALRTVRMPIAHVLAGGRVSAPSLTTGADGTDRRI